MSKPSFLLAIIWIDWIVKDAQAPARTDTYTWMQYSWSPLTVDSAAHHRMPHWHNSNNIAADISKKIYVCLSIPIDILGNYSWINFLPIIEILLR